MEDERPRDEVVKRLAELQEQRAKEVAAEREQWAKKAAVAQPMGGEHSRPGGAAQAHAFAAVHTDAE